MPQYFFHLHNGHDVLLDGEGIELAGPDAAATLALREARSLISHDALDGYIDLSQYILVEAPEGAVVHRLNFSDAVTIGGPLRLGERR